MKILLNTFVFIVLFFVSFSVFAQNKTIKPQEVVKAVKFDKSKRLKDIKAIPPQHRTQDHKDKEFNRFDKYPFNYAKELSISNIPDPVRQSSAGEYIPNPPIMNFPGMDNVNGSGVPDTDGDVGPDHYFQMINFSFAIWDKSGNLLYGPADNITLWDDFPGPWSNTNSGDPIVLYDHLADRWMASQMAVTSTLPQYILIAVSETGDPLGSWYRYAFEFYDMPDYPKFGVWPDGYYLSINQFNPTTYAYEGAGVVIFNREQMLAGNPDAEMVFFDLDQTGGVYLSPFSLLPSDLDGTPPEPGTPNYFVLMKDDAWGFDFDQLQIYECIVDWNNTSNSSVTQTQILQTEPFDSDIDNITQPATGNTLRTLANRLMFRNQFRNFGNYQTMVLNHTVDVNNSDHAGIRWYELRKEDNDWTLYQQGTYAPDSENRWMGSIAMDMNGNIAVGYSVSSNTVYPSIRYTGRRANDPLGVMTFAEEVIMAGQGSLTLFNGWGDYCMMSVDPVDNITFWFTHEYVFETGSYSWKTRIASFQLTEPDVSVSPDSLVFFTYDECFTGKEIKIKNTFTEPVVINQIDTQGYFSGGADWNIEDFNITLPYTLNAGDSLLFNIVVDFVTEELPYNFVQDTLFVISETNTHEVLILLNEELLTGKNENLSDINSLIVFPNTFNESTNITFSLSEETTVNIDIYNFQGEIVKSFQRNKKFKYGNHSFSWDGKDNFGNSLSNGMYYIQLKTSNKTIGRKIILK